MSTSESPKRPKRLTLIGDDCLAEDGLTLQNGNVPHLNSNDKNDEIESEDTVEIPLPSRRRFLSLTANDLLPHFTALEQRKSVIQIAESPLNTNDDQKGNEKSNPFQFDSPSLASSPSSVSSVISNEPKPIESQSYPSKPQQQRRCSMRKSVTVMDKAEQQLLVEQNRIKQELEKQFQQFEEYKEIEHLEQELFLKKEDKQKQRTQIQHQEDIQKEQRQSNLNRLEKEKESELAAIREMISQEFSKRDEELNAKQMEIENMRKALESKLETQHDLNKELVVKSKANDALIQNLENTVMDLMETQKQLEPPEDGINEEELDKDQDQDLNEDVKKRRLQRLEERKRNEQMIHDVEDQMHSVEREQEEILKEIHDGIEVTNHLEVEEEELKREEMELMEEHEDLEMEKTEEIKKRSKKAFRKFDIRRANLMLEASIELKSCREQLSLLDTNALMEEVKLKVMKRFKEQRMRLKLQLQRCKGQQLPFTIIPSSQFQDESDTAKGTVRCAVSPNGEMVAMIGRNGVLQVGSIKKGGENVFMKSLKPIIAENVNSNKDNKSNSNSNLNSNSENEHDSNLEITEITEIKVLDLQWDADSTLLGVLLVDSSWIGIWNSISLDFYQFTVANCTRNITAFAWSNRKLLLGMDNGDIHIRNTLHGDDSALSTVPQKMEGPIGICRWSKDYQFGIVVEETHIAVTTHSGATVERIDSKKVVMEMHCGKVQDTNLLSIVSSRNVIFHGIKDKSRRKMIGFDPEFGSIISHCWCHDSVAIAFENGHIMVLNAMDYSNQHVKCGKGIKCMDAVFVKDIGFLVAVIDNASVRFLRLGFGKEGWKTIAMLDYKNPKWILKDQVPVKIHLAPSGKHAVLTTCSSSVVIYTLMKY